MSMDTLARNIFAWSDRLPLEGDSMRRALDEDGFILVKSLISAEEIASLRNVVRGYLTKRGDRFSLGKTQPNAAAIVPGLDFIFAHERVLATFKSVLGPDQVVFTGHCDIHMNMLSGWHKDSGEAFGGYFKGDYFAADDCKVYKIALYLQDHPEQGDGLTIRRGSHRTPDIKHGEAIKLPTRAGDAVIFDVRLNHTGQLPNAIENGFKALSRMFTGGDRTKQDPAFVTALKGLYWKAIGHQDRLSVFFTYGVANEYTYDFAFNNLARQDKQSSVKSAELAPALIERLMQFGVKPYSMIQEHQAIQSN